MRVFFKPSLVRSGVLAAVLLLSYVGEAEDEEPAAIVGWVDGEVIVKAGDRSGKLELFDWLFEGTILSGDAAAGVRILFHDGAQYEAKGPFRLTIRELEPAVESGRVEKLDESLSVPGLSLLVLDAHASRAAAVRVRGGRIVGLSPDQPERVLPGPVTLSFTPVPEASQYLIRVEDEQGLVVFSVSTAERSVLVPEGIVAAGATYFWSVRSLDGPQEGRRGDAMFSAIGREAIAARERVRATLENHSDPQLLIVAAGLDWRLGLREQARKQLERLVDELDDQQRKGVIRLLNRWEEEADP